MSEEKRAEPVAAMRIPDDVERECSFCAAAAAYLVEAEGAGYYGRVFCCDGCSQQNRIWVRENELLDQPVRAELRREVVAETERADAADDVGDVGGSDS